MKYSITKTLPEQDFQKAKAAKIDALKTEGFGVLTEIDLQATMKSKLGKDDLPFLILGVCNAGYAYTSTTHLNPKWLWPESWLVAIREVGR